MKKIKLDSYENEIEKNALNYEDVSSEKLNTIKKVIQKANKNKTVSFRLSENELEKIKTIAKNEGLPYQTLISSVLHKYINHRLIEEKEITRAMYLLKMKDFVTT